jgi:hypothetical protein
MSEIHGAVGSYVVNALDDSELQEFVEHLAVCDTCSREIVEFSETSAELSAMVSTPPPAALRGSILSAIREVRPLPPELPVAVERDLVSTPRRAYPADAEDSRSVLAMTPSTRSSVDQPVDELGRRRQRRTSRILTFAVAAAMVVALALGGWVVTLVQQRQAQVADAGRQRQAQVADARRQTELLTAPDAKVYAKTMANGAKVSFVVSKTLDKAMLIGDLPDPGQGKQYQLWTIDKAKKATPDALVDGGTASAWFTGPVSSSAALAVTIEPSGGSQEPTLPILANTPV